MTRNTKPTRTRRGAGISFVPDAGAASRPPAPARVTAARHVNDPSKRIGGPVTPGPTCAHNAARSSQKPSGGAGRAIAADPANRQRTGHGAGGALRHSVTPNGGSDRGPRVCPYCGRVFTPQPIGRPPRFCSKRCRVHHWIDQQKARKDGRGGENE